MAVAFQVGSNAIPGFKDLDGDVAAHQMRGGRQANGASANDGNWQMRR